MSSPGQVVRGLDEQDHLWIVLSDPTSSGTIALANLTTHRPPLKDHGAACVLIRPGEHPFVERDSCIAYHRAAMRPSRPFDSRVRRGDLAEQAVLTPPVLRRVQLGALASARVPTRVREAIRATLAHGG